MIALDNDSVHTSQIIVAAQPHVAAANVELVSHFVPHARHDDPDLAAWSHQAGNGA